MSSRKVPAPFVEPLMTTFSGIKTDYQVRVREVAEIISELRDPMKDEEFLLEVTKDNSPHIAERVTFTFDTANVHYKHDANPEYTDIDLVHSVPDSQLIP